jgi:hypothetical protein
MFRDRKSEKLKLFTADQWKKLTDTYLEVDTGDTVYTAAGAQLCEDEGSLAAHGALRHQV